MICSMELYSTVQKISRQEKSIELIPCTSTLMVVAQIHHEAGVTHHRRLRVFFTKQAHTVLYLWSQDQDNSRLWSSLTERRRSTILEPQTKISWHSVIFCLGRPKIPQCVCSLFYRTIAAKPLFKKRPKHNQTWSKQTHQSIIWQNTNTQSVLLKIFSLAFPWVHLNTYGSQTNWLTWGNNSDRIRLGFW